MKYILNRAVNIGGATYQTGVDVTNIADAGEMVSLIAAGAVDAKASKASRKNDPAPEPEPPAEDDVEDDEPVNDEPAEDETPVDVVEDVAAEVIEDTVEDVPEDLDADPLGELADVSVDTFRESNAIEGEDTLTLDDDVVDLLAAAGLDTVGKLDAYRNANRGSFVKLHGIGRATSPRIVAALDQLIAAAQ